MKEKLRSLTKVARLGALSFLLIGLVGSDQKPGVSLVPQNLVLELDHTEGKTNYFNLPMGAEQRRTFYLPELDADLMVVKYLEKDWIVAIDHETQESVISHQGIPSINLFLEPVINSELQQLIFFHTVDGKAFSFNYKTGYLAEFNGYVPQVPVAANT